MASTPKGIEVTVDVTYRDLVDIRKNALQVALEVARFDDDPMKSLVKNASKIEKFLLEGGQD